MDESEAKLEAARQQVNLGQADVDRLTTMTEFKKVRAPFDGVITKRLVDIGVLVTAGSLINGTTITLYEASERNELEFFHIKLARHDVIYAEGAPCETLLDVDANAINFAEYLRDYGPPIIEDARCAPWVGFGPRVEMKSHFRSAISPWIDRRQKLDIIRDELEKRGTALLQQSEFV